MSKSEKLPFLRKFEYIELILLIGFGAIFVISFMQYRDVPMRADYVPNAITGLTTLSGILTAFAGLWLTRQDNFADKKTKKWLQKRAVAIILVIITGLLLIAGSLTSLVYQSVEFAFNLALLGTFMIVWVVADILFFQVFSTMTFEKAKNVP